MFVPLARLVARRRAARTPLRERRSLAARLRAEAAARPDDDERELARRMRALKDELAAAVAAPGCCTGCAAGRPWPGGAHAGGHCCSGDTATIFSDDDVAALAQAGTRPRHLVLPASEAAGCAFRGATGCSLAPADRSGLCHSFLCDDLRAELHRAGRLDSVEALVAALDDAKVRFAALRAARLERTLFAELARDLAYAKPSKRPP
jgi:hypothetical protein